MSAPVTAPSKGHPIRAQWATDVTHRLNDCAAALAAGAVKDTVNLRGSVAAPHPFLVVGGTDEGDAKLTVYVPTGSLVIADEEIDAGDIEGISAVDGAPGYYTVDDLDDLATTAAGAQPLYLIVWRDDTETTPSTNATVTLDPDSITGTVVIQATIARVWASTPEGGSTTYGAVAEQLIRSAVVIAPSSSSGAGTSTPEFLYSYKLSRVANNVYVYLRDCHLMVDGNYVAVLDTNANGTHWVSQRIITTPNEVDVYLNITRGTNGWSASFGTSATQGAKWSIRIGRVARQGYAGANMVLNYVVGALILNSGNASTTDTAKTVDVLTDVDYSTSTHKLTKTKKTVTVLDAQDTSATSDVFTATDHANEHPNGL